MKNLSTVRLLLPQVDEENAPALWRVMQSAHLREFQDVPRFSRDEFVRRVAARPRTFDGRLAGRFEWLVIVRGRQEPVGWVSLRVGENGNGSAEVGYSLVVGARGNGYASEAVLAILQAAFETQLAQIEAACVPANAASRRLLERLGFTQLRIHSNGAVVRGKPVDICIYRLTREEFASAPAVSPAEPAKARPQSRS